MKLRFLFCFLLSRKPLIWLNKNLNIDTESYFGHGIFFLTLSAKYIDMEMIWCKSSLSNFSFQRIDREDEATSQRQMELIKSNDGEWIIFQRTEKKKIKTKSNDKWLFTNPFASIGNEKVSIRNDEKTWDIFQHTFYLCWSRRKKPFSLFFSSFFFCKLFLSSIFVWRLITEWVRCFLKI